MQQMGHRFQRRTPPHSNNHKRKKRSVGRQLNLRNTSSSIVLPCAEEEARIWKLSRRREDRSAIADISQIAGPDLGKDFGVKRFFKENCLNC
nr:unnamed protein product [Callosobruchus chinensis]